MTALALSGYSAVDATGVPEAYITRLDETAATDFWKRVKRQTFQLLELRAGQCVLDVGCGTGDDVRTMAGLVAPSGEAVGVDVSRSMIEEARRRSADANLRVRFDQAEAEQLPFADASFDACRVERVLQHLAKPWAALAEMVRVTRAGGHMVAVEPDYGTLSIVGADPSLTRRIVECRGEHFRSGRIGRQLTGLCFKLGLDNVAVSLFTLANTELNVSGEVARLRKYAEGAQLAGVISVGEANSWLEELSRSAEVGRYRHALTVFVVSGRKR